MQRKRFLLPVKNLPAPEAERNALLRSHPVVVEPEFVVDGEN